MHCYWLPLPGERAGGRGERHREPSHVESPDAHPSLINPPLTPTLSLRERELVVGGAPAPRLAMVSRGESFDSTGGVGAIAPHPNPLPEGEGASSWRRHGSHAGHGLSWRVIRFARRCCCNRFVPPPPPPPPPPQAA